MNCHGLVTDAENNIYLTYQNDGKDQNCLIKWKPDGTGGEFMTGGGTVSSPPSLALPLTSLLPLTFYLFGFHLSSSFFRTR